MQFTACDIDLFHVQLRSIFDYLAKLIMFFAAKPDQVGTKKLFRKLQEWLKRESSDSTRLGVDLAAVVEDCDWFRQLKDVRDSIVHRGGMVLVFSEQGRILFQVKEEFSNKISISGIMYNENTVDFELYVAILVGYLFHYLENVANVLHTKLKVDRLGSGTRNYHSGLGVVRSWFDRVCAITES
ncbi:MAG: hypothetical protein C4291_00900 [Candidatus Dadabacteria bacterium]